MTDLPPPAKRRRSLVTSSPIAGLSHTSSNTAIDDQQLSVKTRAQRLAGFDDEEEDDGCDTGKQGEVGERKSKRSSGGGDEEDGEDIDEHCAICLSPIVNKTVVFPCHHGQFCWNCIRAWTDQSRKCPLCLGVIEHLIHNIRSPKDYSIHYLLPLHAVSDPTSLTPLVSSRPARRQPTSTTTTLPRHALYGRSRHALLQQSSLNNANLDSPSSLERLEEIALERRRYIYREGLYAKHVASNRYTGFKPFTPQSFVGNQELKSRVIRFIRRELQVFPAVDVSFLTTYLISIASQLDLRSSSALRLISDFLSDQDAQHLVHEITTFARSPFKSLEGYDKYVQYGRPQREEPKRDELEKLILSDELEVEEKAEDRGPRFAQNMTRRSSNPMTSLPARRSSRHEEGADGRARRSGSLSPLRLDRMDGGRGERMTGQRRPVDDGWGSRDRRDEGPWERARASGRDGNSRRNRDQGKRRIEEPDWRDRDLEYRGSYYTTSESRRDGRRGRNKRMSGSGRDRRRTVEEEVRRSEPGRSRSRSRSRSRRRDGFYSRSPSPGDRRRSFTSPYRRSRARSRTISPPRRSRSRSSSATRSPTVNRGSRSQSPSHPISRRSRSPTPRHSPSHRSPTPPPPPPVDDEDEAISLSAPALSPRRSAVNDASPSISSSTMHEKEETSNRGPATISIFGAAKRLLGNGNFVTFSKEGRVQLQMSGRSRIASSRNGEGDSENVEGESGGGRNRIRVQGKGKESDQDGSSTRIQDPYRAVPAVNFHGNDSRATVLPRQLPKTGSLLSRIAPATFPPPPIDPLESTSPTAAAAATVTTTADAPTDLRQKLQARLTAEYRQALALKSDPVSGSPSSELNRPTGGGLSTTKVDLRSLLRSRLQAEKALAYDSQVSTRFSPPSTRTASASTMVTSNSTEVPSGWIGSTMDDEGRTTFSQATRDLLMMRLEEEKALALQTESNGGGGLEWYDGEQEENGNRLQSYEETSSLAPIELAWTSTIAISKANHDAPTPSDPATESGLKAKLLEKRKLALEEELKKRSGELKEKLMRDKLKRLRAGEGESQKMSSLAGGSEETEAQGKDD